LNEPSVQVILHSVRRHRTVAVPCPLPGPPSQRHDRDSNVLGWPYDQSDVYQKGAFSESGTDIVRGFTYVQRAHNVSTRLYGHYEAMYVAKVVRTLITPQVFLNAS